MDKYEKIVWGPQFSVDNPEIDKEHKELISVYNELIDFIQQKKSRKEMAKILSELTDHSLKHFHREEEYMEKLDFPRAEEHKKFHRDFIYKVSLFNSNLLSENPPQPEEIVVFLHNWWFVHIQRYDREYENYKKEKLPLHHY